MRGAGDRGYSGGIGRWRGGALRLPSLGAPHQRADATAAALWVANLLDGEYGRLSHQLWLLRPIVIINLYFQQIRGYSALLTGLALLPETGMVLLGAALSGRVAARVGPRIPMAI